MTGTNRLAATRRELSAARQIPYVAHVSEGLVKTQAGDYVQAFRLVGASFESADDDELNNWHERLNVMWRNIASPNVAKTCTMPTLVRARIACTIMTR